MCATTQWDDLGGGVVPVPWSGQKPSDVRTGTSRRFTGSQLMPDDRDRVGTSRFRRPRKHALTC